MLFEKLWCCDEALWSIVDIALCFATELELYKGACVQVDDKHKKTLTEEMTIILLLKTKAQEKETQPS